MSHSHLLLGQTLSFVENPFLTKPNQSVRHLTSGAVYLEEGLIVEVGPADILKEKFPKAIHHNYGQNLIIAGFVDSHAHYPQTAIIASWGKRLLEWLEDYTFPEETKFSDPDYAAQIAQSYLDLIISHGTTTVCTYCSVHSTSVDAIFKEAERFGMRLLAGKTCMDRNAPSHLLDTSTQAYDESKRLIDKWNNKGRLSYVITPRFALTSTPDQLSALGTLWSEYPDCLMQTHLCEQTEEIAYVRRLFPDANDYLDVYETFGLLGGQGLYGHAIHLNNRERMRLLEVGSALIHCPTSNLFLGSGLFSLQELKNEGQIVGLATDTGGGSSFSMLRTQAAAYEISQMRGHTLHPAQLLWLATVGNAETLHLQSKIGNLAPSYEADIIVIDLYSTETIEFRAKRADNIWESIFPTILMGDDRAIVAVWIGGNLVMP